ncbi:hypothetical protein [Schlesneria paludicola]|uniref:hypothetical protein n=1 Tax=Schlesneria paludicola TaxID=360056 RepID=UPI00029B4B35|nr:hypothetical protein [Schlesneria paludicola]
MSTSPASSVPAPSARLTSLDQFRGYTMLGMLLVNYLGSYHVCPQILKHSHDYCSYADTIMPQFLFAAGFAMRLSLGKRLAVGGFAPWGRAIRRILGLALVAILWYGYADYRGVVEKFNTLPVGEALYVLFKRPLFQTLLHIAATSLWILPVIAMSWKVRLWYAVASGLAHVGLSYWFNYEWVFSPPTGIDGGPLGFLTWSIPAIAGTIACDAVRASGPKAASRIALSGIAVMLIGWGMSNASVLYNVPAAKTLDDPAAAPEGTTPETKTPETTPPVATPAAETTPPTADAAPKVDATPVEAATPLAERVPKTEAETNPDSKQIGVLDEKLDVASDAANQALEAKMAPAPAPEPKAEPVAEAKTAKPPFVMMAGLDPKKYALDPVFPSKERIQAWDGTFAEPPFVPPPGIEKRKWNYWMMSQRHGTLPYPTFAAGVALVIYALFLWLCDGFNLRLGLFRTLGTNSLAAYCLHDVAGWIIKRPYFPSKTSSDLWALFGFVVFALFVYACCRLLERMGWYIRV